MDKREIGDSSAQPSGGRVPGPGPSRDRRVWVEGVIFLFFLSLLVVCVWAVVPRIIEAVGEGEFRSFSRAITEVQLVALVLFAISGTVASGSGLFTFVARRGYVATSWVLWIAGVIMFASVVVVVLAGFIRGLMRTP